MSEDRQGIRGLLSKALRPKKSRQVLRKQVSASTNASTTLSTTTTLTENDHVPPVPVLAPLAAHNEKYRHVHAQQDTQLGETLDHTSVIHAIGIQNFDVSLSSCSPRYRLAVY